MRLTSTRLALFALVAGVLALPTLVVAEGWFSDFDDAKEVSLGEILRNPDDYMGVPVKVKVYFDREAKNHNPYYTRFIGELYGNFSAWPTNARLYEERDFRRSYPNFFMRKDNKFWKKLNRLDRVTPIELEAVVRHIFRGQPYFEVFDYDREGTGMRLDEVRDVVAGDAYYKAGKYEDAADRYSDACSQSHYAADKAVIHRKLADARFQLEEWREALRHYEIALDNEPESEAIKRGIAAAEDRIRRSRSSATEEEKVAPLIDPAPESRHPLVDRSNDVDEIIRIYEPTVEEDHAAVESAPVLVKEEGQAGEEKLAAPEEEDAGTVEMDPESSGPGWAEVPSAEPEDEVVEEQPTVEEQPVEQPVEETVEEVVEEVVEEQPTVEEQPVEQPVEETVEEVVEEVVEEQPTVEEQPVEQPVEETVEEVVEEVVEEPAEEEVVVTAEEPVEEMAEEPVVDEPAAELPEQEPLEEAGEEPVEEALPASEEGMGAEATESEDGGSVRVVIPLDLDQPVDIEPAAVVEPEVVVEEPVDVEPTVVVEPDVDAPVEEVVVDPVVVEPIEVPRLPFFGCGEVTTEDYRAILMEIAQNPGG